MELLLLFLSFSAAFSGVGSATWCVVRSDASEQAMQTALDYACAAGADCAPLQSSGLCFLPNTLPAHASYAFNSYYQRRANAPGSCTFSGAATIATTDPSYGSCVYPSSSRNAGGQPVISSPTIPLLSIPPPPPPPPGLTTTAPLYGGNGGVGPNTGGTSPAFPDTPTSKASHFHLSIICYTTALLLVFPFIFRSV